MRELIEGLLKERDTLRAALTKCVKALTTNDCTEYFERRKAALDAAQKELGTPAR